VTTGHRESLNLINLDGTKGRLWQHSQNGIWYVSWWDGERKRQRRRSLGTRNILEARQRFDLWCIVETGTDILHTASMFPMYQKRVRALTDLLNDVFFDSRVKLPKDLNRRIKFALTKPFMANPTEDPDETT